MQVSLRQFVHTGSLGALRPGLSVREVCALLGEPDAVVGTSRKYPLPALYVYGTVEIVFRRTASYELTGILWEAGVKGAFRLTRDCEIVDWSFIPAMPRGEVEAYLLAVELSYECSAPRIGSEGAEILLATGVRIAFDEN